jgi:hypothetical protein
MIQYMKYIPQMMPYPPWQPSRYLASGVERRAHVHMPSKWALQSIQYGARGYHASWDRDIQFSDGRMLKTAHTGLV